MPCPESKDVLTALNEIAETASKNEKEKLVKKHAESEQFVQVLRLAYDPFLIFGIVPTKEDEAILLDPGALDFHTNDTMVFLQDLLDRKLTGNKAREQLVYQLKTLEKESAELLIRILRKDLRAGFGESTINKAVPDLIPVFPYMRCSLPKDAKIDEWDWSKGVISQEKADGMFANGTNLATGLLLSSRQGSPFPMNAFAGIVKEAETQLRKAFQYHGEILVESNGEILPREIGNGILNSVLKGGSFAENQKPIYVVWDLIPLHQVKSKGKYEVPYANRLRDLRDAVKNCKHIKMIDTKVLTSKEAAYNHFFEITKQGKEGTIIKKPTMIWKDGTSKEQVKLKVEAPCELEIVAINKGAVGTKNENRAGALACKSSDGKLLVDVAVKNEKMRDEIDANPEEWVGKIVTVIFNQILKPSASNEKHSLFLPRLAEAVYRLDKDEADSLERIQAQFNNAINKGDQ